MSPTFKQRCYSAGVSLALHIGLAALLAWSYIHTSPQATIGLDSASAIHSYVALEPQAAVNPPAHLATPKPKPITTPLPLEVTSSTLTSDDTDDESDNTVNQTPQPQSVSAHTPVAPATSHGQNPDALLALLHNAILAKQQYPASALSLKRHGTVQVGFVLQPDGTAHDIELLQSSGTRSLDQAALRTIAEASPFAGTAAYLSQNKHFSLDVVFTLPT